MKLFQIDNKIKILCLVYFMVAQSSMMARATSDSFLLKYFQPESIPLMIMAAASLSIVLALFTTYLCGRFQAYGAMRIATFGIVVTLLAMVCLVYFLGNKGETKLIYVFAYMLCETIVILPMVLFWGMAMGVLNPSESKRWMGLIGAAGTLGCILAGFTISIVSKNEWVNELSLGLVAVVLMIVSLILMMRADLFKLSDDDQKPVVGQSNSVIRKLGVLISSKQSILMTWLVVFSAIVLSLVDINFKFEVRKDYSDDLYDFFGQFYTYTSCAQLILQLLIVRAILTRGGVWAAISILPALLLITAVGALLFQEQDAVYVGKFITQVVFFTIEYVGLQMLFLSVKKKLRGQMNSAVDGLTRPATIATISLLITYTLPFWQGNSESDSVWRLNLIIIVLCICWLFVAFLNYRQYLVSLLSMVGAKIDTSVKKSVQMENFISVDEQVAGDESIFKELSNLDYTKSQSQFSELVLKLVQSVNFRNHSKTEKFISLVTEEEGRAKISGSYFQFIDLSRLNRRTKAFAKAEFKAFFEQANFYSLSLLSCPKSEQFDTLVNALEHSLELRVQSMINILPVFDPNIDFPKLIELIKAQEANAKAEAIEVLKGVLGPQRTDSFVSLVVDSSDNDSSVADNLVELIEKFSTRQSSRIHCGLLAVITDDNFANAKSFVIQSFDNPDGLVRQFSLEIYLSFETDNTAILDHCNRLCNDPVPEVSSIATERLGTS
jgi:hypothetical protein